MCQHKHKLFKENLMQQTTIKQRSETTKNEHTK